MLASRIQRSLEAKRADCHAYRMDLLKGHDWTPLDRSIDGLVARLRKKIERGGESPQLFKTVRGVGYAFAGQVRRL